MTTTITSHHFLSTCSVLGSVLDLEGGFKQDKRHHPVLQAACYLIWELKLSQMMRSKNSNKHYFSKCKMACMGSLNVWCLRGCWLVDTKEACS